MKSDKWFGLERIKPGEGERLYDWPEKTRRMWKAQLKDRLGAGIRRYFKATDGDLSQIDPAPAIFVFFPKDYDMSGHLASIRKVWENLLLLHYGSWREKKPSQKPGTYFGTGAVVIWTRQVLRELAELSPLFAPIWEDLKDLPPGECGIYLADAPDAAWLESIRADEPRLFAEFREARDLDKIGLDLKKPEKELVDQHIEAFTLIVEEKRAEAEALLESMLVRWPGFWKGYFDLAVNALNQDDPERAYAVVRRAQQKFPDCLNFDRLAVDACMMMEDWRRAEWHLKRLWGMNPWDPNLIGRYARVAFGRKDYALAAKLYEERMECVPLAPHAKSNYAVALGKTNRCREALALFKELEKGKPKQAYILNNIGILLASVGRPQEGLEYCRRALALDPEQDCAWDSLGFTHLKIRNYPEAAKAFLKAVELNPSCPDAWRHLLHTYHDGGEAERLEGAKAYVRRVLPEQLARFEKEKGTDIPD
jgi:tetratricopeptide (TPR) repeat protein